MADEEVYLTAQAAHELQLSPNTIRSWKQRKGSQLKEGVHWIMDGSTTLWTPAGLTALQQLQVLQSATIPDLASATDSVADDQNPGVERVADVPSVLQRYQHLVDAVAGAVVPELLNQIDQAVVRGVGDAIACPLSPRECVTQLQQLGLRPINTANLLNGGVAGLVESKEG
jgi:hypothetical protein